MTSMAVPTAESTARSSESEVKACFDQPAVLSEGKRALAPGKIRARKASFDRAKKATRKAGSCTRIPKALTETLASSMQDTLSPPRCDCQGFFRKRFQNLCFWNSRLKDALAAMPGRYVSVHDDIHGRSVR
jgi:hypothetical protein